MAARTVAALIMSGAFFSSRVLYKSIIRGLSLLPIACDRPILRSASALRAHMSLWEGGYISLSYEEKASVRGDFCAVEVDGNRPVEVGMNGPFFLSPTPATLPILTLT